jgi:hypothetical protein
VRGSSELTVSSRPPHIIALHVVALHGYSSSSCCRACTRLGLAASPVPPRPSLPRYCRARPHCPSCESVSSRHASAPSAHLRATSAARYYASTRMLAPLARHRPRTTPVPPPRTPAASPAGLGHSACHYSLRAACLRPGLAPAALARVLHAIACSGPLASSASVPQPHAATPVLFCSRAATPRASPQRRLVRVPPTLLLHATHTPAQRRSCFGTVCPAAASSRATHWRRPRPASAHCRRQIHLPRMHLYQAASDRA